MTKSVKLAIGCSAVFAIVALSVLAYSYAGGFRMVDSRRIVELFQEAESSPTARIIIYRALAESPMPTVAQFDDLQSQVRNHIKHERAAQSLSDAYGRSGIDVNGVAASCDERNVAWDVGRSDGGLLSFSVRRDKNGQPVKCVVKDVT